MLEVYNHLISSYYPKYKAKSVTQNKDVKNIYKNILSINKQSPLFKLQMTDEKQKFALSIKDTSLSLRNHLDYLADPKSSAFTSYKISSSDTDTATVKLLNNSSDIIPDEISLKVNQLAKPQINESYEVVSDDISNLSGSYSFIIDIEDSLYEYQFQITSGSTNEAIFTKLSDFIKKSNIGLNADVSKTGQTSKLILTSQATGSVGGAIFTIRDTDKIKRDDMGIVNYYGFDNTVQDPKSSSIEINGENKETLGNRFTFNKILSVTIHKTNEEPLLIQSVPDETLIYDKVNQLLDTFNSLIDLATANRENRRSAKLLYDLDQVVINNYESLKNAGIQSLQDSHLAFDEESLSQSVKNGDMQNLFSNEGSFSNDLRNAAYNISLNPMDYLDKVVVTYPNTSVPGFINPYSTSNYSGMLFNLYC